MAHITVTIARQYGSGGKEVGRLISERLGMKYHDKSLTELAAERSGISKKMLENADERATPSFLYSIAMGAMGMIPYSFGMQYETPINDKLFALQSEIILEEAKNGPSVFVGRCADFVLRDTENVVKVFIYADEKKRAEIVSARKDISMSDALTLVNKIDKNRANYYNYYTTGKWGKKENYNLMIDTTQIGTKGAVKIIEEYIKLLEEKMK